MTLLLSTAFHLYWLGRYMRRAQELPKNVLDTKGTQRIELIRYLGWPQEYTSDLDLEEYIYDKALPEYFDYINSNMQAVRAVIDADASELFNQVRRLQQSGSPRAACFQLYACSAVMQEQSVFVTRFWQLGDYVEMLDQRIRHNDAQSRHYRYLAQVVTMLPDGTGWDQIKQQIQAMVFTTDSSQFYVWHDRLLQLFEDGV
ncbi:hypothetical protein [Neisseria sp.]|uniref:hypothetical protein n=1 Tax=Neisseria sp. TaxID=192066 RepID=UPI00289AD6E9|nr:hypothetical protein [Neisseria sp.]